VARGLAEHARVLRELQPVADAREQPKAGVACLLVPRPASARSATWGSAAARPSRGKPGRVPRRQLRRCASRALRSPRPASRAAGPTPAAASRTRQPPTATRSAPPSAHRPGSTKTSIGGPLPAYPSCSAAVPRHRDRPGQPRTRGTRVRRARDSAGDHGQGQLLILVTGLFLVVLTLSRHGLADVMTALIGTDGARRARPRHRAAGAGLSNLINNPPTPQARRWCHQGTRRPCSHC